MTIPTDALTTRQKVKDLLGISDTTADTVIDELITYWTQFIKTYCGGRKFLIADYVEVKDTPNGNKIFLNQRPVNTIATVEYRAGTPSNITWITYSADNYLKYLGPGYIQFFQKFIPVPQALRVSYNAGYLIDFTNEFDATKHTLPFDLTGVCTELVSRSYNLRAAHGLYQESTEGQSVTYSTKTHELTDDHENVLNSYKMARISL